MSYLIMALSGNKELRNIEDNFIFIGTKWKSGFKKDVTCINQKSIMSKELNISKGI